MTHDISSIIGKHVKDMYGSHFGKILGTMTDIDGSIQTVGVDCGSDGLKEIPYDQLVLQGSIVIHIPKWRLDAQKILREKSLTLKRLKALNNIVSDNDEMKSDAELVHQTYKSKLHNLDEIEEKIKSRLTLRLEEIEEQEKSIKVILFDAKVQFKSGELSEPTFESIRKHTHNILERLSHERTEVTNIQSRIDDLSLECLDAIQEPKAMIQESAISYLDSNTGTITESSIPNPPNNNTESPDTIPPTAHENSDNRNNDDPDWISRMQSQ